MTDRKNDEQTLWQSQPLEEQVMSLEEIRQHSTRFEKRISRRNLRDVAGVVVVIGYGFIAWATPSNIVRTGAMMIVLGTFFICDQLRRRGTAKALPADLGLKGSIEFLRGELERQRDLLLSVFWWYLLPLVPGMLVMMVGLALDRPDNRRRQMVASAIVFLVFVTVFLLNRRVAGRIQRRIDQLRST